MIEVFKITKHKYDYKVVPELIYNINKVTRANDFRLSKNRIHYNLKKFSFTNRIVNIWNSLPNALVDVDSFDLFKSRLDNFRMSQDVKPCRCMGPACCPDSEQGAQTNKTEHCVSFFWRCLSTMKSETNLVCYLFSQ